MESFPPPAGPVAVRDRLKEAVRGFLAELKERGRQRKQVCLYYIVFDGESASSHTHP